MVRMLKNHYLEKVSSPSSEEEKVFPLTYELSRISHHVR